MLNDYEIVGRKGSLFRKNFDEYAEALEAKIKGKNFLVIGAGGSIGAACAKEIFARGANLLHCVDLSENGLVELVRTIRSSKGYTTANFDTFALDCGSVVFESFFRQHHYDYVLNLTALKHVRSENSVYTMLRMIEVNILNTVKIHELCSDLGVKKYFCVSTDKAANPTNFMGATKRAMELCLFGTEAIPPISSARFANVAFSQGSLLEGFTYRLRQRQPISAPSDIERYFITQEEAGEICILSTLLGENGEILFPDSSNNIQLTSFVEIIEKYLLTVDRKPIYVEDEEEARRICENGIPPGFWPVNLFKSDTNGEKAFEEFYLDDEKIFNEKYINLA